MKKVSEAKFEQMSGLLDDIGIPYKAESPGVFLPKPEVDLEVIYSELRKNVPKELLAIKYKQPLCVIEDIASGEYNAEFNYSPSKIYTITEFINLIRKKPRLTPVMRDIKKYYIGNGHVDICDYKSNEVYCDTGKNLSSNFAIPVGHSSVGKNINYIYNNEKYVNLKFALKIVGIKCIKNYKYSDNYVDENVLTINNIDIQMIKVGKYKLFKYSDVLKAKANDILYIRISEITDYINLSTSDKSFVRFIVGLLNNDMNTFSINILRIKKCYIVDIFRAIDIVNMAEGTDKDMAILNILKNSEVEYCNIAPVSEIIKISAHTISSYKHNISKSKCYSVVIKNKINITADDFKDKKISINIPIKYLEGKLS